MAAGWQSCVGLRLMGFPILRSKAVGSSLQELAHYCMPAHIWATHGLEFVNGTLGCGEPGDNDTVQQPVLGGTTEPLELQGHLSLWGTFPSQGLCILGGWAAVRNTLETKAEGLSGTNRESTARAFPQNSQPCTWAPWRLAGDQGKYSGSPGLGCFYKMAC